MFSFDNFILKILQYIESELYHESTVQGAVFRNSYHFYGLLAVVYTLNVFLSHWFASLSLWKHARVLKPLKCACILQGHLFFNVSNHRVWGRKKAHYKIHSMINKLLFIFLYLFDEIWFVFYAVAIHCIYCMKTAIHTPIWSADISLYNVLQRHDWNSLNVDVLAIKT